MSLPTQTEIFTKALDGLDRSRNALSDTRDWLRSDWAPVGKPLPDAAADARISVGKKIAEIKQLIDTAKRELYDALDALPPLYPDLEED
jgi:hypothetical protein